MVELIEEIKRTPDYRKILADRNNGRLYHGYILESDDPMYLDAFGVALTMLLMCERGGCGSCDACLKVLERVHIDAYNFPMGGRKIISAKDDIDIFRNAYALKPLEGESRVFIFDSVNSVRDDWQNKLLKSLEEPTLGSYIIIKTDNSQKLLPTIRSRCNTIALRGLQSDDAIECFVKKGFDKRSAKEALWLFDGNITLTEAFLIDEKNRNMIDDVFNMLANCLSSKDCFKYVSVITSYRDNIKMLFFSMSKIFHKLLNYLCTADSLQYRKDDFVRLSQLYSVRACGEILELIAQEKKKTEQNVMFQAVAEDLILKIMEVKYRCRQ